MQTWFSSQNDKKETKNIVILAGQDIGKESKNIVSKYFREVRELMTDGETYIDTYKPTLKLWGKTIIEAQLKTLLKSSKVDNVIIVWIQDKLQTEVDRILGENPELGRMKERIHIVEQWKNYWENVRLWLETSKKLSEKLSKKSINDWKPHMEQLKKSRKLSNTPTVFITWDLPFITPEWIDEYIKNIEDKFNENQLLKILFSIVHKDNLTDVERKFFEWLFDDIFSDGQKKGTKEQNIFAITNDTNPEKIQEFFSLRKLRNPVNIVKLILLFEKYVPNEFHTALEELIKNKWVRLSVLEKGLNKIFGEGLNKVLGEVAFLLWEREELSKDVDSTKDLETYINNLYKLIIERKNIRLVPLDKEEERYNIEKKRLGLLNEDPKFWHNKTSKNNTKESRLNPLKLKKNFWGRFK